MGLKGILVPAFAAKPDQPERLKVAPFKPLKAEAGNAQKRPLIIFGAADIRLIVTPVIFHMYAFYTFDEAVKSAQTVST